MTGHHLSKNCLINITLWQYTLQILEIFQLKQTFLQGLSQPGLNEVFVERDCNYNLWNNNFLNRRRINSVRYGNESVLFLAPKCILSNGFSILSKAKSKNGFHGKALVDVDFVKHTYRKKDLSERRKSKNTYHWISWRQLAFKSLWKCYCNSLVDI